MVHQLLNKIEWKIAFKTALSAILTLFASQAIDAWLQRPDAIISGLWAAVASIVVQQTHLGTTYKTAWNRFMGILVGSIMGGALATFMGSNPFSVGAGVFCTIVICSVFNLKDSMRIACLTVAIIMLLWGIRPQLNPWVFAYYRFTDSCLGIFVAVLVAHTVWPLQISKKLVQFVTEALDKISIIYSQVTVTENLSLEQQSSIKKMIRESYDLIWKARQLLEDSKLELLTTYSSLDQWKFFFNNMENLLDRLDILSKSYRQNLSSILDGGLYENMTGLVKSTEGYLKDMTIAIEKLHPLPPVLVLRTCLEHLNEDIRRFRSTKRTHPLTLDDVEGYYVFFYNLRLFTEEIIKAHAHMEKIISEP